MVIKPSKFIHIVYESDLANKYCKKIKTNTQCIH